MFLGKGALGRFEALLLACLAGQLSAFSANVIIDLGLQGTAPENAQILQGDTVVWRQVSSSGSGISSDTRSYTGEWKSQVLGPGETFAHLFLQPGTFVYSAGTYSGGGFVGERPATIRVQPLTNSRPAISLVSPPDGFAVPGHGLLQAAVTNSASMIELVQFFDRDKLIGVATNAPYRLNFFRPGDPSTEAPTYVFTAKAINKDGSTNESPPIVVRDHRALVFDPLLLPDRSVVFFYSMEQVPNCVERTADFVKRLWLGRKGESTFFDNYQTNAPVRIYQVRTCL